MELNWKIEWMRATPAASTPPSRVLECGWRCTGVEGKLSASAYGSCRFEPEDDGTFVPYEQLTQDAVLRWCWGSGVDKDAVEAAIAAQIADQKNPPTILPALPWA
jgi:hypothetical protein